MRFVDVETGEIVYEVKTVDPVMEMLAFLSDEHFKFTLKGLEIVGNPTFEQCERKYKQLAEIKRLSPIYLGILLNFMEKRWGDKYAQVTEPTGYSYQTIANAKSVMGKVAPSAMQPGLTLTHYKIAAPCAPKEQERLLKKAHDENMNTTEFNHLVRQEKRKAEHGILPARVRMEMTATFEVPEDLKCKLRDLAEGWTGRLWEWDIVCERLSIKDGEP